MGFAIGFSILAGAFIVISRNINSLLADKIGLFPGTLFNYITGVLLSFIFLLFSRETSSLSFNTLGNIPLWAYLGGFLGVTVVIISNIVTPKISAFYMSIIIFVGQLFTGTIIDFFTMGILSPGKVIGGLLVVAGLLYNLRLDTKIR